MDRLTRLISALRDSWRLLLAPSTPWRYRLIPLAALIYVITPVDLIPEVTFPLVGSIDDVTLMVAALTVFRSLAGGDKVPKG